MNPAMSVVVFTAIAGAAQGLVVALAVATLIGVPMAGGFVAHALLLAAAMATVGLLSSFGHLGRPARAWRAVLMWRTSWLSRECLVLPAFIGWTLLWWALLPADGTAPVWLPLGALLLSALLWLCTAMIYACLRFIQEWAQPLTLVNFILIGQGAGLVLVSALAAGAGEEALLARTGPAALGVLLAALAARCLTLARNAALRPRSTLHSATGIRTPQLVQKSMGMSAGAFNTREFFHGRTAMFLKNLKWLFLLCGFVLPGLCAAAALAGGPAWLWPLAVALQVPGLLAERWFFFAQARHPQNLYYQVVS
ncbi:DMSO reductase [Pseudorhodoferax aquiterrae]|uniref:DMSO reductase n=1 Tax=Pseudorhodoferax aquiterrae TaxID=747304 RepID=A0ABQ3FZN0_9BURK|nr:DmsC/YnfH family molybdoenzyme membrane anchor subunit [Pseudorhodoferax aquiterrae]GHC77046.1 DMSO reductase [Pseudorhodoferax aquiterrae]